MGDLLEWIDRERYLSDEIANLRAKLAKAEAERCPALVETGESGVLGCPHCGEVREPGHTWRECVEFLTGEVKRNRNLAIDCDADRVRAEADRDAATARAEREAADAAAMRACAKLGWSSARSLAILDGHPSTERAADEALAEIETGTAGAAMLREVEAGREYADAVAAYVVFHGGCAHHPDDCPGEDEECRIVARLREKQAAYDAARGAK